jgi:hypothetical protein
MEIARDSAVRLFSRGPSGEEPIVFAGEPASLEADVWLHNEEEDDLLLQRATLTCLAMQKYAKRAEIARLSVPRVVAAGQRKLLSMSFDIDPTVPPGIYEAEVRLEGTAGSKEFFAQIIVTQNYQLSLEPDQFVFAGDAGRRLSGEVVVWNEGNVPVDVSPMGEVRLEDPDLRERCPCCGAQDELREKEKDEFGSVVIANDTVVVEPGTWALVKFKVILPDSLPANAHLRARPRVGNERFNIDILTPVAGGRLTKERKK